MRTRLVAAAVLLVTTSVSAQDVTFAAASVRRNTSGDAGSSVGRRPGGRLQADNATLRELILFAYPLQNVQLVGGPAWVATDRWNIAATLDEVAAAAPDARERTTAALRTLLSDRFRLVLRPEVREMSVYALVRTREGGTPGPSLKASASTARRCRRP
jgi:uncharacterized protein (TIGR03435 family)